MVKYSYGTIYVPSNVAVGMYHSTETIRVFCNDIIDGRKQEHKGVFTPTVFPKLLFPIQDCDSYCTMPTIIPLLKRQYKYIYIIDINCIAHPC